MPGSMTEWLTRDARTGAVASVLGTAVLVAVMAPFEEDVGLLNEGLMLLLLTLGISATWGLRAGLFAAVVTNLSLNFFFIPPLHTLSVRGPRNLLGLGVFLVASVVAGSLLSQARNAAAVAQRRRSETETLLQLSRGLIGRTDPGDALRAFCETVVEALGARGAAVLSTGDAGWSVLASAGEDDASRDMDANERVMAERALETGTSAARGDTGLSARRRVRIVSNRASGVTGETSAAFVPLRVGDREVGVLRLDGPVTNVAFRDHAEDVLGAIAREAALGIQRVELARSAAHAEALEEADRIKTILITSISHDLKTPLAGIKASVSSLRDRSVTWSEDDRESFLEAIESQSDRLNEVISDILDLDRIEAGTMKPAVTGMRAMDLVQEAVGRAGLSKEGRRISLDVASDLVVRADPVLAVQALSNLIENADRHSTPGGDIRLSADRVGCDVEIAVSDDGPGIAAGDLAHVFEPFYRGGSVSAPGHGLGLSIVKGFIELCGGRVRVESTAAGSRFIMSLPSPDGGPAT